MLTEEQVARAKRQGRELGELRVGGSLHYVAGPVADVPMGGHPALFVGGPLDGRTVHVPSFAPTRLVRLGGKTPGEPVAFKGGTAPPGRWAVYDLRGGNAGAPVYDFKRERGR